MGEGAGCKGEGQNGNLGGQPIVGLCRVTAHYRYGYGTLKLTGRRVRFLREWSLITGRGEGI